jgi:SAM-dependent methyltransferase/GNAT superfamily N-acetyltransferase
VAAQDRSDASQIAEGGSAPTVDFEIRRAGVADVNDIAAAHQDSIRSIGARYYDAAIVTDWGARVTGDLYVNAMANGEALFIAIGELEGQRLVLGFSSHRMDDHEHRTAVYVRGGAARRGIGSALFKTAEDSAIAAGASSIHVDASLAAVEFYRENGFTEISRGEHRLGSGRLMPCIFMRKDLPPNDSESSPGKPERLPTGSDTRGSSPSSGYYGRDLALVHHSGFRAHADACAAGILRLLDPTRAAGGRVVELGCGSGILTRHLVDAGLHVIATDASDAMLDLARRYVPEADLRRLVLPDDPIPEADAIVSVGHVLNYLPNQAAIEGALVAVAQALRPRGVLTIDLCDLEWGTARRGAPPHAQVSDEWAIITRFSVPVPTQFVREITVFVREDDGSWRRDDERHDNVLLETSRIASFLAHHGIDAAVGLSFGGEALPAGLKVVIGRRR